MSTWGRLDYANNKPKFPKEREVRTTIRLVSNTAANIATSNTRLFFPSTANLTAGMFIFGNNIPTTANSGFFKSNVSIVTVNPANVIISQALTANTSVGDIFTFSSTIQYDTWADKNYNANTFNVSATRKANTGFGGFANTVAHSGWVKITVGTGGRANRVQTETLVAMSNNVSTSATSGGPYFPGR